MPEILRNNIKQAIPKDDRFVKINAVTLSKTKDLQTLLDNSYSLSSKSGNAIFKALKHRIMLHNVKKLVRENSFLKAIHESNRDDLDILASIFNIINSQDKDGNTPIMKAILHDDIKTLDYLLNKVTTKLRVYNEKSPKNKIYLHNILDTANNQGKTALHIASESNLKCYNLLLDYMKINYSESSKFNFVSDGFNLPDRNKIKNALSNAQALIKNSFSLAVFFSKDAKAIMPSLKTLKSNLITSEVSHAKACLNELFVAANNTNKSISKKQLKNTLDAKMLCKKLNNVDINSPDIILSRFKVLTEKNQKTGLTPIMQATKNNDYNTLSLLLKEVSSLKKSYTQTCNESLCNHLDITDSNYNTALSFAIKNKSAKCVELLLKSGTTLGNDFEYTKSDSYIIQAIKAHDSGILNLLIKHYLSTASNKDSLKNYLSATTSTSSFVAPIGIAIDNGDLDCAMLLENYKIALPQQFKNSYDKLKIEKHTSIPRYSTPRTSILSTIFKNIVNSLISLLHFLGIVQFRNS